jgi:hypothetical protein
MNDHIHLFATEAEFTSAYTNDYTEPWVSFTMETSGLSYNKKSGPTPPSPYLSTPLTFNIISGGTIKWQAANTAFTKTIEYSKDSGNTWTSITSSTAGTSFNVNAGDKVLLRGNNATYSSGTYKYNSFKSSTAKFEAEGNIMSLIDSTGYTTATTLTNTQNFRSLFVYCIGLISAKNLVLPATALTEYCYSEMFLGCASLTTVPTLPATTLASRCYQSMFQDCTELTTAPELPATNLASYCYSNMFQGCTELTAAPELPAISLTNYCYYLMFYNCTSLASAPELPATTLAESCYRCMFQKCTSLTSAPELPATGLAIQCYYQMFHSCTSLNSIKCLATDISANHCTDDWVDGVASTGIFVKPSTTDWSSKTGSSGIPNGWTVQDA